jgi:predicted ArsR family transcriptional regulator
MAPVDRAVTRRDATPAEFKAMAHPLRLRIIRLCQHEAFTNKEIADRLGQDPATVLHHVRTLCAAGFLAADTPRTGKRGALEKPYRSTGKSWTLSVPDPDDQVTSVVAAIDALRAEILDAGPSSIKANSRLGLRLTAEEAQALADRIDELVESYAARDPAPDGQRYGLFVSFHRLAPDITA